jgi:hypothetical protein
MLCFRFLRSPFDCESHSHSDLSRSRGDTIDIDITYIYIYTIGEPLSTVILYDASHGHLLDVHLVYTSDRQNMETRSTRVLVKWE